MVSHIRGPLGLSIEGSMHTHLIRFAGDDTGYRLPFNSRTMKFGDKADNKPATWIGGTKEKIHTNHPKVLKIMLGTACNFRCKYCRQFEHSAIEDCNWSEAELEWFLRELQSTIKFDNLERVEYWGGEPLLYWNTIAKLIDALEFITKRPLLHHITTNGSLLTAEITAKLTRHNFQYKLSHDGPGQNLRSGDPLKRGTPTYKMHHALYTHCQREKKWPTKGVQQEFYINSVLTKEHPSPKVIVDWFINEFDEHIQIMKIEPVIPYNDHAQKYTFVTADDFAKFQEQIYQDLRYGNITKNVKEYQNLWRLFMYQFYDDKFQYNPIEGKCHASQEITITVDRKGNLTPCQVYNIDTPENVIGQLDNMSAINEDLPNPVSQNKKCAACPVVSLCRGVCPYILKGEFADTNCKMRYNTYMGIFRAFYEFMKIEPNLPIAGIDRVKDAW